MIFMISKVQELGDELVGLGSCFPTEQTGETSQETSHGVDGSSSFVFSNGLMGPRMVPTDAGMFQAKSCVAMQTNMLGCKHP